MIIIHFRTKTFRESGKSFLESHDAFNLLALFVLRKILRRRRDDVQSELSSDCMSYSLLAKLLH